MEIKITIFLLNSENTIFIIFAFSSTWNALPLRSLLKCHLTSDRWWPRCVNQHPLHRAQIQHPLPLWCSSEHLSPSDKWYIYLSSSLWYFLTPSLDYKLLEGSGLCLLVTAVSLVPRAVENLDSHLHNGHCQQKWKVGEMDPSSKLLVAMLFKTNFLEDDLAWLFMCLS